MVERNEKIDIVIPYYNDNDPIWKEILHSYLTRENSIDRQVTGDERYRDWDTLPYWFRGIEENCKWVNKVYLVLASETQVPNWLDKNNPKLQIVYHKDFIPKELLPTFNPITMGIYFCNIKGLSDNYIVCDDDYFFLNPIDETMFFVNNYPVYQNDGRELKKLDTTGEDGTFYAVLNNGMDLQLKISGEKAKWYALDHLPVSHKKDFEKKILEEYYDDFMRANKPSRFRHRENIPNHVFVCLYKDLKPYYKFNCYGNSCYVSVRKDTNFDNFKNKQMVCFNDTQLLNLENFDNTKQRLLDFLESKLPNKSSFEK